MADISEDRAAAAGLPEGDVVRVLLEQHTRIRELFSHVTSADGEHKSQTFDELRALLAVHETAEEMVLRPVTERAEAGRGEEGADGTSVAEARNHEESEANKVLKQLEGMDAGSAEFDTTLASFEQAVLAHAEAEETEEFPLILSACDEKQRAAMGKQLQAVEALAPTHPHPSTAGSPTAQWAVGPFASLVDRARDAVKNAAG
jgi:hypothetical protein